MQSKVITYDPTIVLGADYPTFVNCEPYIRNNTTYRIAAAGPYIATRISDGKLQLIISNNDPNRSKVGYFVVYTGTDPTQSVFSSVADANAFLNTPFTANPPSKLYDDHKTTDVTTVYSSKQSVTYSDVAKAGGKK